MGKGEKPYLCHHVTLSRRPLTQIPHEMIYLEKINTCYIVLSPDQRKNGRSLLLGNQPTISN